MEDVQRSIMNQQDGTFRFPAPSPLRWWGSNAGCVRVFIPLPLCVLCRASRASLAGRVPSEANIPAYFYTSASRCFASLEEETSTERKHFLFWGEAGSGLIVRPSRLVCLFADTLDVLYSHRPLY